MDRTAIFIDAGYLFAAGSTLIAQEKLPRREIDLDFDAMKEMLDRVVSEVTGLPLLRIYWYDGTSTGPTPQQLTLAYKPSVKLRLGFVNQQGQQKGVDSLIVTDLLNLARNRAMADALLMTGDEDIRVGVQQAQQFGVRVHLIGIAPSRQNQSGFLLQEVDSVHELSRAEVSLFLRRSSKGETAATEPHLTAGDSESILDEIARTIAKQLGPEELEVVVKEAEDGSIPQQIDRRLLVEGSKQIGGTPLTSAQKRQVRRRFVEACRAELSADPDSETPDSSA